MKERKREPEKHLADSLLRAATFDHRQKNSVSKKKTIFQQLLLDWAYGCDLFYPIQRHGHLAENEEDDKRR
ncbi:TorA maturation chaperone TorD [Rhizobium leguminosarum]